MDDDARRPAARPVDRYEAERSETQVEVAGLTVGVKVRSWRGEVLGWKAEHDDLVEAARSLGWTPDEVAAVVDRTIVEPTTPG